MYDLGQGAFETSYNMDGLVLTTYELGDYRGTNIRGWRFTCTRWPDADMVQQQVVLRVGDREIARVPLCSILTVLSEPTAAESRSALPVESAVRVFRDRHLPSEAVDDVLVGRNMGVQVNLVEREVPNISLRLHIRGVRRLC